MLGQTGKHGGQYVLSAVMSVIGGTLMTAGGAEFYARIVAVTKGSTGKRDDITAPGTVLWFGFMLIWEAKRAKE